LFPIAAAMQSGMMTGADETLPAGVLLAGGRARRMGGRDKALLTLRGRTLLARAIAALGPQVAALALSANGAAERFGAYGLEVLADTVPDQPGPLAGILAGMLWARHTVPKATHLLSAPTDSPFLPPDLVARLRSAAAEGIACAGSAGRTHHAIALWPLRLAPALAAALARGEHRVGAFAARHGAAVVWYPDAGIDPFFNVNTPEDLIAAAALLAPRSGTR